VGALPQNSASCLIQLRTGACVGALHGYVALPGRWVQGLENGVLGRDEALRYAHGLAQLDVRV